MLDSTAKPVVRPLNAEDREIWGKLWTGYLDDHETSVAPEVYDTIFARLLSGEDGEFNAPARRLYDRAGVLTPFIKHARP